MAHINDRADMGIFDGTIYEGKTYLQVRRMLTVEQLARFKALTKRNSRKASLAKANRKFLGTSYCTI